MTNMKYGPAVCRDTVMELFHRSGGSQIRRFIESMTATLAVVLLLLAIVILLFAVDWPRMDAVALIALCALPLTGVIQMPEALAGFSDGNIVLIAAMFVIGEGLVRTGVTRNLGDWLVATAGASQTRLVTVLMLIVCGLGATMSSTAVTAIFIPVVMRICRRTGISPGQLMMPLSAAALISGMTTLVATAPNLVINSELIRQGKPGFTFFAFTPFGVPVLGLCIVYMLFARRWLPSANAVSTERHAQRRSLADWIEQYRLVDREHRLQVTPRSSLIGQTLETLALRSTSGVNLIAIQRHGKLIQPGPKTELLVGDVLFVDIFRMKTDVDALAREYHLVALPLNGTHFIDHAQEVGMAEVFVSADSNLVGETILKAAVRTRFGFSVIGLRRGAQAMELQLNEEQLRIGDTLLVIGPWKSIRNLQTLGSRDLVPLNLPAEFDDVLPAAGKSTQALLILLMVVVLMITAVIPHVQAALIGCLLMGALGCIDFESAYRSIDWKTIVLIVGMLPFSIALERTGGVQLASGALMSVASGAGTYGILAALFATTAILSLFISNTATAVLMAPVALSIAAQQSASPSPFAMIVALAASTAFMTPVSSPVNMLVVTPGGYRFSDFVRIGVPFSLIVMVVSVLMVPWLLPL